MPIFDAPPHAGWDPAFAGANGSWEAHERALPRLRRADRRRAWHSRRGAAAIVHGEPEAVTRYGPFESEDGKRSIEIVSLRPQKDMFVARLKGVDDRNAAEALRNIRLYVPRERLGEADDDEFFHADLIGLAVVDRAARARHDRAVENFGAGDLHRDRAGRTAAPSYYLAFTKQVVPEIDIAGGRIVVDPPAEIEDGGPEAER